MLLSHSLHIQRRYNRDEIKMGVICQMTFLSSSTTKAVFNGYLTVKQLCNLRCTDLLYPQRYYYFFFK